MGSRAERTHDKVAAGRLGEVVDCQLDGPTFEFR